VLTNSKFLSHISWQVIECFIQTGITPNAVYQFEHVSYNHRNWRWNYQQRNSDLLYRR